ncbi:Grx4 family monothiol glutaredoxin [Ketobacter sp.]|uniref:Grx4 family monothiol glutaredoxin n=1 Tax=Ketobacter sp. TaxID=2083498 RepID=UPI000F1AFCD8|nr:Grx4 family monothiol glutaredoxin [Ketobacter sp.]RLU01591.1 MAG: Grx4 family monothiol glutaredoxin [Ketobacter sp.]
MDTLDVIKDQIGSNSVLLYMKGTPQFPQCGFSARAVEALMSVGKPFAYVNILEHPDIRAELPKYANWPTFPQLWVKGELIGGSDIILEMAQQGELQGLVEEAAADAGQ